MKIRLREDEALHSKKDISEWLIKKGYKENEWMTKIICEIVSRQYADIAEIFIPYIHRETIENQDWKKINEGLLPFPMLKVDDGLYLIFPSGGYLKFTENSVTWATRDRCYLEIEKQDTIDL